MNTGIDPRRPAVARRVGHATASARENENLPAFVVMQDNASSVVNGPRNWGAGFMPAVYQGTRITAASEPIPNLNTPAGITDAQQRGKLDFLNTLNREHAAERADCRPNSTPASPATSSPSACRPRPRKPSTSPRRRAATKQLYGMDDKETADVRPHVPARPPARRARRPLRAALPRRRQQVGRPLQASRQNHTKLCHAMDKPVAGLLNDLKRRGLLDDTLVDLGRRVRPHADERKRRRPRPQPHRLHDVDGRRRREGRPDDRQRPTSSACTPSRTACTSTTSTPRSCTCSASTTWGSSTNTKAAPNARRSTKAGPTKRSRADPARPAHARCRNSRPMRRRARAGFPLGKAQRRYFFFSGNSIHGVAAKAFHCSSIFAGSGIPRWIQSA